MDLPLALQDVWGSRPNRNKSIRFPESAFKESLIASGEKVNWLADPVLDWGGHMIKYEEKTQALEDACNYFKGVATRRIEPGPEKLKEVLTLIEERFLGGVRALQPLQGPALGRKQQGVGDSGDAGGGRGAEPLGQNPQRDAPGDGGAPEAGNR